MNWGPGTLFVRVFGAGAVLLIGVIVVGIVLPGTWTARADSVLPAPPGEVMPHVDGVDGWRGWTPWPDSGVVHEGPSRGVGSAMRWESDELGDGRFEIVAVEPSREVRYRVEVQKGTMVTEGTLRLSRVEGGTHVSWVESGSFGWNPLMAYVALAMPRMQAAQMTGSLDRLARLIEHGVPADTPADTLGGS